MTAGPSTAGPSIAEPSTAGPSTAGPSTPSRPGLTFSFSDELNSNDEFEPNWQFEDDEINYALNDQPNNRLSSSNATVAQSQSNTQSAQLEDLGDGVWNDAALRVMLTLIHDMRHQYDKPGNGFKSRIWSETKRGLETKGYVRTTEQIQNKYGAIKGRWREREWLLSQSGFGIDTETKRVTAAASCWEELRVVCLPFLFYFVVSFFSNDFFRIY